MYFTHDVTYSKVPTTGTHKSHKTKDRYETDPRRARETMDVLDLIIT